LTGFVDLRYKNGKLRVQAKDINQIIKALRGRSVGSYLPVFAPFTMSFNSEKYSKKVQIKSVRDVTSLLTAYDDYLDSELKRMLIKNSFLSFFLKKLIYFF